MNPEVQIQPDWRSLNFHQVMVLICDTFEMTHPQMMSLRQKIEQVYGKQKGVSVKAFAILAYYKLQQWGRANGLTWVLQAGAGKLTKAARKYNYDLQPEQS